MWCFVSALLYEVSHELKTDIGNMLKSVLGTPDFMDFYEFMFEIL